MVVAAQVPLAIHLRGHMEGVGPLPVGGVDNAQMLQVLKFPLGNGELGWGTGGGVGPYQAAHGGNMMVDSMHGGQGRESGCCDPGRVVKELGVNIILCCYHCRRGRGTGGVAGHR